MAKKNIWMGSGGFAGIPRHVMKSADYKSLSGNAVKLLLGLSYQYRGKNNGDLTCAWSVLKEQGFNSPNTAHNAKNELLKKQMIKEVRKGVAAKGGSRLCSLYALTWQPLDETYYKDGTPKHGKPSTKVPLRNNWCDVSLTKDDKKNAIPKTVSIN